MSSRSHESNRLLLFDMKPTGSSRFALLLSIAAIALALASVARSEQASDALLAGFADPPSQARPLVYWQWVNGNVTEDGIRQDLEWMKRVGIEGVLLFDIGFRTPPVPQYVEHRVGFGTPEWRSAVRFTAAEAQRLGLQFGAQSSGGWSVSGGPNVAPENAMKKLVWSEVELTPTTSLPIRLPLPPSNSGPFQDVPIAPDQREPTRYEDVAAIAYRIPDVEQSSELRTSWRNVTEPKRLEDRRYEETVELVPSTDGTVVLHARLDGANTARSFTLAIRGTTPRGAIEYSIDGIEYTRLFELPNRAAQSAPAVTFALGERSERHWRVRFENVSQPLRISEARFDAAAYVHRFQEKAGYGVLADNATVATSPVSEASTIRPSDVIDVSRYVTKQGDLSWRPHDGRWAVLRFGWSLTGKRVVPATPESIGLEVDKLDANAVRSFAREFYGRYREAIGDAGALQILLTDSWEAGQQNWTPSFFEEFAKRRGYDLRAWMPVLTGRIIGDAERSERFLSDFRRTIADLIADNHYGVLAQVAEELGMVMYAEAAGTDLPTTVDGIQAKSRVHVPMGEFWVYPRDGMPKSNHVADIREAASASHVYDRGLVAAEALTTMGEAPWAMGPRQLRPMADRFFAEGVNRIVLHTSAHQPFNDRRPGITLRQYGQHFTRHETWAEDADAWVRYLSRTSFMLQQGVPVADLAIYLGEGAPLSPPFEEADEPRRLAGYDYDFINAEALLTRLSVRDGALVFPNGGRYRMLVLPETPSRMSLPVIEKLEALVKAGAVIVGPKPIGAEGLGATDEQVLAIADRLWGTKVSTRSRVHGRGRIYAELGEALRAENIEPDVSVSNAERLHWAHRATDDADIYFISNQSGERFSDSVEFRITGRHVEVWDAVEGSRKPVAYSIGRRTTSVSLVLEPHSSQFIVFRGKARAAKYSVPTEHRAVLAQIDDGWSISFIDGRGAPMQTQFPSLRSWTEDTDPAIRYYSGRVMYTRTIDVPAQWLANAARIELDLGEVAELARVRINGVDLGVLWTQPFKRDITEALREGENRIEIFITNYWANRLIGDQQPGAQPTTFTVIKPYSADAPLRPSGLLGPVRLISVSR